MSKETILTLGNQPYSLYAINKVSNVVPSKYIILQTSEGERAVIFAGDSFYHDDVASHFDDCEVISAGSVCFTPAGSLECYGRSTGLNIESRGKDDEVVIKHQLRRV
jgi:hypothetical protein